MSALSREDKETTAGGVKGPPCAVNYSCLFVISPVCGEEEHPEQQ